MLKLPRDTTKKTGRPDGVDQLTWTFIMRLMRLSDVSQVTGLRRSTIYKYIADGAFPKAVPLGGGRVAWLEHEIQEWISGRVLARGAE